VPYITDATKKVIDDFVKQSKNLGELIIHLRDHTEYGVDGNGAIVYLIYKILKNVYGYDGSRFEERSNALKVLESAKLEFYRRILAPYEDRKIVQNGDVL